MSTVTCADTVKNTEKRFVPPGALCSIHNRLPFLIYEFTSDETDPQLNKSVTVAMPETREQLKQMQQSSDENMKVALAFSAVHDTQEAFEADNRNFVLDHSLGELFDGVFFDRTTFNQISSYGDVDVYYTRDEYRNATDLHVLPKGWRAAKPTMRLSATCTRSELEE